MEKFFEFLRKEGKALSAAPLSFVLLSGFYFAGGLAVGTLYFSERIASMREQLTAKEGLIGCYRVALSIDPASQGALTELSHDELRAKALSTIARLRDMCQSLRFQQEQIAEQFNAKIISDDRRRALVEAIRKEVGKQFVRTLRADASNVDNELRRRLGPTTVGAIPTISPNILSTDGATVDLLNLMPSGTPVIDDVIIRVLGDSIEQVAKLLPSESNTRP